MWRLGARRNGPISFRRSGDERLCSAVSMKDLRPIRNQRDYDHALAEVEQLWGAKAGTAKGDRLDILATLIEAYETEYCPMDPPVIRALHDKLGISAEILIRPIRGPKII